MPPKSFLRALLIGAAAVATVLLAVFGWRSMGGDPEPVRFDPAEFVRERPRLDAPYVASAYEVVAAMLGLAEVRPGDYLIDLGSGDGRIVVAAARSHGARGLGVDIDPQRIRESRANARAAGVAHRVEFRRQDLFETPLDEADVVTLYLSEEVNRRLRPRILAQMRPGARVVSHDFGMGEWQPDVRRRIGASTINLWIVPARVEGRWTLSVAGQDHVLELDQSFQELSGTVSTRGGPAHVEQGQIAGRRIRFVVDLGEGPRAFEGRVADGRIEPRTAGAGWRAVRAG